MKILSFRPTPDFHCFLVFICGFLCVYVARPDQPALQTSTDMSRGPVGSHSIEEAPGSSVAFSLPLGSVWAAQQNLLSPFLPQPRGPSLRQNYKGPPTAGSLLCPPSFSQNPRPASISRRYSIHRRRALITKQDYGPCLGTTCQGACSLSCSLSSTHTLQRQVCLCVFFWEGDLTSSDGDTAQNRGEIYSNMPLSFHLLMLI